MQTASWYIALDAGMRNAQLAANVYGLPQTVFQTDDTCGWANTNALAGFLCESHVEVFATMLPRNYFL